MNSNGFFMANDKTKEREEKRHQLNCNSTKNSKKQKTKNKICVLHTILLKRSIPFVLNTNIHNFRNNQAESNWMKNCARDVDYCIEHSSSRIEWNRMNHDYTFIILAFLFGSPFLSLHHTKQSY